MTVLCSANSQLSFADEFLIGAARAGIDQAVFLASELDPRPYDLPWPAGTAVYVLDQPEMLDLKSRVMARRGVEPNDGVRSVAADLRGRWAAPLRRAGFDPDRATAWSVGGLLPFLPSDGQARLIDNLTVLSHPGSMLVSEVASDELSAGDFRRRDAHGLGGMWDWCTHRADPARRLSARNWTIRRSDVVVPLGAGLRVEDPDWPAFAVQSYLTATLGSSPEIRKVHAQMAFQR